jgi:hypothetical protein
LLTIKIIKALHFKGIMKPKHAKQRSKEAEKRRKAIIVWVMVIAIVGSSIGFALMYAPSKPPAGDGVVPEPTSLLFSAKGVEGRVAVIFNSFYVLAYTDKGLKEVDDAIYSVEGIKRVTSEWVSSGQGGIGAPIYRGQVFFERDYTLADLSEKVRSLEVFEYAEVIGNGMVELPQTLTIENKELSITKEHTLRDSLVNAQLSGMTQKDDIVKVDISLYLSGATETQVTAVEMENITASPQPANLEADFKVTDTLPELYLSAKAGITSVKGLDTNSLIDRLRAAANVEEALLEVSGVQNSFPVKLDGNYSGMEDDINAAIYSAAGVSSVTPFLQQNIVFVEYAGTHDFSEVRDAVEESLAAIGIEILEITEPELALGGRMLLDGSAAEAAAEITAILEEKGFSLTLALPGVIAAETILHSDTNTSYLVADGNFAAMLVPDRRAGDTVSLQLSFQIVRNRAEYISAQETGLETA